MIQLPLAVVDPAHVQLALLAVMRLSGMLALTPPVGHAAVPLQVRIGLAFALVFLVWGAQAGSPPPVATTVMSLVGLAASELLVGLTFGFVARTALAAATFAAELVSAQIGFGLASVLDPSQGAQVTVLTRLYDWTMLVLFLALDAHHLVIGATVQSLTALPLGAAALGPAAAAAVLPLGGRVFSLGLALVLPAVGVLFVTNLLLVIAARAVPQLQLMSVGWPVTVLAGLGLLLANIDAMSAVVGSEMRALEPLLIGLVRSFAGGR
jgi:flagellar biosynthetic protein FliR